MNCNIPFPDLYGRLEGTVCLYKGEPYIVRTNGQSEEEDGASGIITLYDLTNTGRLCHTIESSDPDFDIATPPLGYCQTLHNRVAYITRRPYRKWKQGIIWDALYIDGMSGGGDHFQFHSDAFKDSMAQRWRPLPFYLTTLARDDGNYSEIAISNDVCLVADGPQVGVWFKNEAVGFMMRRELTTARPTIIVPTTRKAWVVKRYLADFNFNIIIQ